MKGGKGKMQINEIQTKLNVYIEALQEAELRLSDAQAACVLLQQIARDLYHLGNQ
jgi:hypothetical protein